MGGAKIEILLMAAFAPGKFQKRGGAKNEILLMVAFAPEKFPKWEELKMKSFLW